MKIAAALAAGLVLLLLLGAVATWLVTGIIERRYPPIGRMVEVGEGGAIGRLHLVDTGPAHAPALGTVVLLHGASGNLSDPMLAIGRRLAERYRVIAVDRPGHGWSDRVEGKDAAAPTRQAALIAQALRSIGVRQAVVVGHSLAGAVVPNLALDHTDVTAAILLLAPVTHPWPNRTIAWYYGPATAAWGKLFTRTITTPLGLLLLEPGVQAVFAPLEPPPGYVDAARIPLTLRPASFEANAQDVAGLYDAVVAQAPRYPNIRLPATVIAGDMDRIVYTDVHARAFAREVAGTKLVVLPGVGHMPHYAAPDLVISEIDALAARLRSPQASRVPAP